MRLPFLQPLLATLLLSILGCPQSGGGGVSASETGFAEPSAETLLAANPAPPAPASVIPPFEPWSSLGELSGVYGLSVTRFWHDCRYGPDVPKSTHWRSGRTDWVETESYTVRVTHRSDVVAFELGEGVVLARFDDRSRRLVDVRRIGAEGETAYLDGFAVSGTSRLRIEGESRWAFEGDHYGPFGFTETCDGRTRWSMRRDHVRLDEGDRDLQVVLRWSATSRSDLDLTLTRSPTGAGADLLDGLYGCYVLHSAGFATPSGAALAGAYRSFVANLEDTRLPWHEEVVRCSVAPWGLYRFTVWNWDANSEVEFEIEVFSGPGVNTGGAFERSFGAFRGVVGPLASEVVPFELKPPPAPTGGGDGGGPAGIVLTFSGDEPLRPAERTRGFLSRDFLEENKAALEGLDYDAFVQSVQSVDLDGDGEPLIERTTFEGPGEPVGLP